MQVHRRTENGEAPGWQGAATENIGKLAIPLTEVTATAPLPLAVAPDMLDQTRVGCGHHGDGLLSEAEEQLPGVPRGATVESKRELIEVVVQMCGRDRPLMGAEEPAPKQRDDAMHMWQQPGRRGLLPPRRPPVRP